MEPKLGELRGKRTVGRIVMDEILTESPSQPCDGADKMKGHFMESCFCGKVAFFWARPQLPFP